MARTTASTRTPARNVFLSALLLAARVSAQTPGTFENVGSTLVSAMVMFLGNDDKVYILDKSENNPASINGHPAWGVVWDIAEKKGEVIDVISNSFCAAGFHLPNSSWATFGGNKAVTPDTSITGVKDWDDAGPAPVYTDLDGRKSIRLIKPCSGSVSSFGDDCQWYDDVSKLAMQRDRWYATAEALGDGSIMLIGGMIYGGYINRFRLHDDPVTQHRQAENTIEFFPSRGEPVRSDFLINAGGLNTYAHAFLVKSGKMLLQANISTILLDPQTMQETPLPDMPNDVIRVYPASGGVAMLPLTPENNYTPTILFCGGTNAFNDEEWGDYHSPHVNSWERRASADCQRLTPEPEDGSAVAYEQDDDMIDPRTMGQFIILPDGTLLMINGARNGTAGYTTDTPLIQNTADLPFGMSLASDEVLKPAIYDPAKPKGQRWSDAGLGESKIPRLYHSSAILLPDGSVIVAGSNPSADRVDNVPYPTTYDAEYFYPLYFGKPRPEPQGIPTTPLTYGGPYFNITLANKYANPNAAAAKAKVALLRSGFTTHGMNMGQRYMQLENSYTVADDGAVTLHVAQPTPNANVFTPGPAVLYVVVDGVPSVGKHVQVGNGQIAAQPTLALVALPPKAENTKFGSSDASVDGGNGSDAGESSGMSSTVKYAIIGAVAVVALIALGVGIWCCRRRKAAPAAGMMAGAPVGLGAGYRAGSHDAEKTVYGSSASLATPVKPGFGAATQSDVNLPPQQAHDYERYAQPPMAQAYSPQQEYYPQQQYHQQQQPQQQQQYQYDQRQGSPHRY
ncbi:DUF1929-domain-containing protein [Auricularia subglabra TFB-10046 SS5]|nr:DUF1929-domain-containing protein [Auricularia subglabra TFB-10046 SS5]